MSRDVWGPRGAPHAFPPCVPPPDPATTAHLGNSGAISLTVTPLHWMAPLIMAVPIGLPCR